MHRRAVSCVRRRPGPRRSPQDERRPPGAACKGHRPRRGNRRSRSSPSGPPSSATPGSNPSGTSRVARRTRRSRRRGRLAVTTSGRGPDLRGRAGQPRSARRPGHAVRGEVLRRRARARRETRRWPRAAAGRRPVRPGGRSASATAIAPEPVASSQATTRRRPRQPRRSSAARGLGDQLRLRRGMSARASVRIRSEVPLLKPRMYATGLTLQPAARRRRRSASASSSGASGCASSQLRSRPSTAPWSTSASSRGVSDPASQPPRRRDQRFANRVRPIDHSSPDAIRRARFVRSIERRHERPRRGPRSPASDHIERIHREPDLHLTSADLSNKRARSNTPRARPVRRA